MKYKFKREETGIRYTVSDQNSTTSSFFGEWESHYHAFSQMAADIVKERKARIAAQEQLEAVQKERSQAGLCIDAALTGRSRSNERWWDHRMDAVRNLAVERNYMESVIGQIQHECDMLRDSNKALLLRIEQLQSQVTSLLDPIIQQKMLDYRPSVALVKDTKKKCQLECGAYGTYCRCSAEAEASDQ